MKSILKKNRYLATFLVMPMLLWSSCSGKEAEKRSYLLLEGPVALAAPEGGITQEYTVKSNGQWEVIRKSIQTWAEARPASGQNDGAFRIMVGENTSGSNRSMKFTLMLDGKEQQDDISIVQEGTMPEWDGIVWNEINQDQNLTLVQHGIPAYNATDYLYRRDGQSVFKVKFQEPSVAGVAAKPEGWGFFQQPSFYRRASDGLILLTWHYAPDHITGVTPPNADRYRLSSDNGKTWAQTMSPPWESIALIIGNGDGLAIRTPAAEKISESDLPECIGTTRDMYGRNYSFYRLAELPSKMQGVYLTRYRWKSGTSFDEIREHATMDDPKAVRFSDEGYFGVKWWGDMKLLSDNSLVAGIYATFYELPTGGVDDPSGISFYRSVDHGYSWRILGKVPYKYDPAVDPNGVKRTGFGYIEPAFEVLSDGTFLCVLRTHDGYGHSPQYISRSSDRGVTWSDPEPFTPAGVYPRLLQLENGVLVLVSGRPGVQIRFSLDGKGEKWTDPFEMLPYKDLEPKEQVTCGYASLLATGPNSFLVAYSDFKFLNDNNEERKAVKVREITVNKE